MIEVKTHVFRTTPKILFGLKAAQETGRELKNLDCFHPLLVTDKALYSKGVIDAVTKSLVDEDLGYEIYDGVEHEPTIDTVERGIAIYREKKCDSIVALGGGSCLDAGKGIAILANNPGSIGDFQGWDRYQNPKATMVAIPTTAGTGSEVTQTAIITDERKKIKMRILSPKNFPDVAIEDASLTVSMPPTITAGTGMDALTHAIEGYISTRNQPLTDALAIPAIENITTNLPIAWANGQNLHARNNMMLGQLLAAMTFTNASTALVHGMARTLGAFFHISHGMANAMLLPHVMEFTMLAVPEKFAQIAKAIGEEIEDLTKREAAERAVHAVGQLCRDLHIPTLRQAGVTVEILHEMARDVLALETGTPNFNPRRATVEEVEDIFRRALDG